ncbi:MAG: T9SS type A sorting domain-containing protein [Saprospiraceae bacterium]|nr:T9SS type A sorting domain-containing protein [Saprospiraceae bacterium]MCF8252738.1 T9SS type A sorting domain-containing protein [Saprospiraceae bacterium]MCF8282786.1 T9SS type A sorting domain-containing protein [Bacteroidales bacterium]MCF8313328.1 T9SS type A sorting domain-containing protein [Saprospiraceae bacterium]MCF8441716.1 T9SS type A sorting domain-containing protein [Saprospiraceae bacterium]
MKKPILFILISAVGLASFAQKHDYNWIVGYDSADPLGISETMLLTFNTDPPSATWHPVAFGLVGTRATMSDTGGTLIFYSNGIKIHDADDQLMPNGDSINVGEVAFAHWDGYISAFGMFCLPYPGNPDKYFISHTRLEYYTSPAIIVPDLLYTVVDMSLNNGKGAVTQKNQQIKRGFYLERPSAVRHANGRDWWVAVPELHKNSIFTYRLSPEGVVDTMPQVIGYKPSWPDSAIAPGQNFFSPDGYRYIDIDYVNGIRIYDFDRCTGLFSNYRWIKFPVTPKAGYGAMSPNSRFLYLTTDNSNLMVQFDLWADDIAASADTVGIFDGFIEDAYDARFLDMALGADGKIYSASNTKHMHVINDPDVKGTACGFVQRQVSLQSFGNAPPVYPNYRLGPIDGSPCDTLGIDVAAEEVVPVEAAVFGIYPNPTREAINLTGQVPLYGDTNWELYNSLGKTVMAERLSPGSQFQTIALKGLASGIYYYKLTTDAKTIQSGKIIIQ